MVMSLDPKGKFRFVKPDPASGAPPTSTPGDKSPFVLQGGHDILRCRAAVTAADQVDKVEARGWDVTTKKKIVRARAGEQQPGHRHRHHAGRGGHGLQGRQAGRDGHARTTSRPR